MHLAYSKDRGGQGTVSRSDIIVCGSFNRKRGSVWSLLSNQSQLAGLMMRMALLIWGWRLMFAERATKCRTGSLHCTSFFLPQVWLELASDSFSAPPNSSSVGFKCRRRTWCTQPGSRTTLDHSIAFAKSCEMKESMDCFGEEQPQ